MLQIRQILFIGQTFSLISVISAAIQTNLKKIKNFYVHT